MSRMLKCFADLVSLRPVLHQVSVSSWWSITLSGDISGSGQRRLLWVTHRRIINTQPDWSEVAGGVIVLLCWLSDDGPELSIPPSAPASHGRLTLTRLTFSATTGGRVATPEPETHPGRPGTATATHWSDDDSQTLCHSSSQVVPLQDLYWWLCQRNPTLLTDDHWERSEPERYFHGN